MEHSGLLATTSQLTPEGVRGMRFPAAWVGGYQAGAVDRFTGQVARELDTLHAALADSQTEQRELVKEVARLEEELRHAPGIPGTEPPERQAISVLRMAQSNSDAMLGDAKQQADSMVSGARHQHDQLIEHAKMQADAIIRDATQRAETEHARIVNAAPADAQRQIEYYTKLAGLVGDGLRGQLDTLFRQLADWDSQARQGQPGGHGSGARPVPAT